MESPKTEAGRDWELIRAIADLHEAGEPLPHMDEVHAQILRQRIAATDGFMRRLLLRTGARLNFVAVDDKELTETRDRLAAAERLNSKPEAQVLALEYNRPARHFVSLPDHSAHDCNTHASLLG